MKNIYKKPHFFSFRGYLTVGEFWSSLFGSLLGMFCAVIGLCILVCLAVPGEVEELNVIMNWVCAAAGLVWLIRVAAVSRRRLRDAGFTVKSYLWLMLPVVGWIIFIVARLCARSVENI